MSVPLEIISKLKDITWGYRDKFRLIINRLKQKGYLDRDSESYSIFEDVLDELTQKKYTYDVIINEFLSCLDQNLSWLLAYPELFKDWTEFALKLMEEEWYYARKFFVTWNDEKFVFRDPGEMRFVLSLLHSVQEKTDAAAALAFLAGYKSLRKELSEESVWKFIEQGILVYHNNPRTAESFFALKLSAARKCMENLKKDSYLRDSKQRLQRLLKGIANKDLQIDDFSALDSDYLIESGSRLVCLYNGLYLPARVSLYNTEEKNREWYIAVTYFASFSHFFKAFPAVHGLPGSEKLSTLLKKEGLSSSILMQNLFILSDLIRIISLTERRFPGFMDMFKELAVREYIIHPLPDPVNQSPVFEKLLHRAVYGEYNECDKKKIDRKSESFYLYFRNRLSNCGSFFDIIEILTEIQDKFHYIYGTDKSNFQPLRNLSFFPDYRFRAERSTLKGKEAVKREKERTKHKEENQKEKNDREDNNSVITTIQSDAGEEDSKGDTEQPAGYYYDEWNYQMDDYYSDWCCLQEIKADVKSKKAAEIDIISTGQFKKIRRVFERIRPDLRKKEKNLISGDEIEIDSLIKYWIERKAGYLPDRKIYSRYYKRERDITTLILLDVSGSTGEKSGKNRVLEVEKKAALTLAGGLQIAGDNFIISGFSGNGKNNCRYYIIKDYNENWEELQKDRLLSIQPDSSTRMGVALRHSINKMENIDSARKLIMLITDGRPQDNDGYSPDNKYAQYDVRKACLEALRREISVFAISTKNNSPADLSLMFPDNRYLVIDQLEELPRRLAEYYVKLTV